jgi:hypothetical protein
VRRGRSILLPRRHHDARHEIREPITDADAPGTEDAVEFWEVNGWKQARRLSREQSNTEPSAAFSRDGKFLAVPMSLSVVSFVDVETRQTVAKLQSSDTESVRVLAFSPDGSRLAVSVAGVVRLWDLRLIRAQLREIGLDWDLPAFLSAPDAITPVQVEVDKTVPIAQKEGALAVKLFAQGDFVAALASARKVLMDEPDNTDYLNMAAWIMLIGPAETRDSKEASRLVQQARTLNPNSDLLPLTLALAHYRSGSYLKGLDVLKKLEDKVDRGKSSNWPWMPHLWTVRSLCAFKADDIDLAKTTHEKTKAWQKAGRSNRDDHRLEVQILFDEVEALLKEKK